MIHILITGATGHVGRSVIQHLTQTSAHLQVTAAVRNVEQASSRFPRSTSLDFRRFDFEQPDTFSAAFAGIDLLFLLRPPHISKVKQYFEPLLLAARQHGIQKVVFLSVQGAESSTIIPHHKIERQIQRLGFDYIFVRPSYFMQNLTSTLLPEILAHRTLSLPAGNSLFNWIDVADIGKATTRLLLDFDQFANQAYTLTGRENIDFDRVCQMLSEVTATPITYHHTPPFRFYFKKRKEGVSHGMAMVMTLLHYLPTWQEPPSIHADYTTITGEAPTSLHNFLLRHKATFMGKD